MEMSRQVPSALVADGHIDRLREFTRRTFSCGRLLGVKIQRLHRNRRLLLSYSDAGLQEYSGQVFSDAPRFPH